VVSTQSTTRYRLDFFFFFFFFKPHFKFMEQAYERIQLAIE
jgi:hypothetical protein